MSQYAADAAFVIETMARRAVRLAAAPGCQLGQDKYFTDDGELLLAVAFWRPNPHRVSLQWSVTAGKSAKVITEAEARALVERRLSR